MRRSSGRCVEIPRPTLYVLVGKIVLSKLLINGLYGGTPCSNRQVVDKTVRPHWNWSVRPNDNVSPTARPGRRFPIRSPFVWIRDGREQAKSPAPPCIAKPTVN